MSGVPAWYEHGPQVSVPTIIPRVSLCFSSCSPAANRTDEREQQGGLSSFASQAFELSQARRSKWFTADRGRERSILEVVCLNGEHVNVSLVNVSLCVTMRKPFDTLQVVVNVKKSRGDRIRTCDLLTPRKLG